MDDKELTMKNSGGGALYSHLEDDKKTSNDCVKPNSAEEYKQKLSFVLGRKEGF